LTLSLLQISTLLSSLGGALSLYLGMAVVLLFELIELFADIMLALFAEKK